MGDQKGLPDEQQLSSLERFNKVREELASRNAIHSEQRSAEDRIRDEHHDAQATTIQGHECVERRKQTGRKKTKLP